MFRPANAGSSTVLTVGRPKPIPSPVPFLSAGVSPITPSQIYRWKGPGRNVPLTKHTETRLPSEQKWFKLRGRVVDLRVEADGDIHIRLKDATGNKVGIVGAEVPIGPKWCEIRQRVFGWTTRKFPFSFKSSVLLTMRKGERHVITVTGKAFYDVDHAPRDHCRLGNSSGHGVACRSIVRDS